MLYLAFIFHMHQPYYKNLLTQEMDMPWVRLHGIKDYLDMIKILEKYPSIHQTFNLVPSLIEQIEDYTNRTGRDRFLELSYKPASTLDSKEKEFILDKFFMINREKVIAVSPRYYELYFKKENKSEFNTQDYLDLQVWFNLAWTDPYFRQNVPELKNAVAKARFFNEEEKHAVLDAQLHILEEIIPAYKKLMSSQQIEVTISPYYHPILPLLCNTKIAREANPRSTLPRSIFSYPKDAKAQVDMAVKMYKDKFDVSPCGMWPSEEAVSEHVLPFIIGSGIDWIVTDEAILFKSLKRKKRDTRLLYQPHVLKRKDGDLNIVFRDRNLSDLIGFVYNKWSAKDAVDNFMGHMENISSAFKGEDILVTIAMDGENAWEYYTNDGHDFLELFYQRLSDSKVLKTTTINEYLKTHPAKFSIQHLVAGSWIYADFFKWIGSPQKNLAWEYLVKARQELEYIKQPTDIDLDLAWKQIYILEGSDWFWWYDDNQKDFDRLFRTHLGNFYALIKKEAPEYVKRPLTA